MSCWWAVDRIIERASIQTARWLFFYGIALIAGSGHAAIPPTLSSGQSLLEQQEMVASVRANARVLDALAIFTQAGHSFAYSNSLVHARLKFHAVPNVNEPIERLRLGLQNLGLALESRAANSWLIVPLQAPQPKSASVVAEPPKLEPLELEELLVTSSRYKLKSSNRDRSPPHSLRENELNALPEVGDDALRAALHLPGMATVGVSAKPYVRGGSQDETLVLFDSVELFEPYHLRDFQSIFSSLNPALIESIDVYTGGFPARYGDRMSAVVDIKPAKDHTNAGGELSLSTLTTSGALYGPFGKGQGDWSLAARRGNLDWVTKQVNPSVGDPSYSDWYGQFSYALSPTTELNGTLVGYDDDIVLNGGQDGEGESAQSRYHNVYGWLQLEQDLTPALTNSLTLRATTIRHHRAGKVFDEDITDSIADVNDRRRFHIYSLQNLLRYQQDENFGWELGARIGYQSGSYDYRNNIVRGELATLLGMPTDVSLNVSTRPSGNSGALFASAFVHPVDAVSVEAGLRYDFQNYGSENRAQWSPRLNLRYAFSDNTNLRFSAGRFFQAEGIHELNVTDGRTDFQRPQRADHFIAAFSHEFGDSGFSLRSEAFYKRIRHVKVRYENLFNVFVMLPELTPDRVEIAPGNARARGLEVSIGYNRDDRLITWISYTLAKAEDRLPAGWEPRSWDQRHTLSTGFIWRPRTWEISASLLTHSGWPTTTVPARLAADDTLFVQRNAERLDSYLSLDLRLARRWERGRHSVMLYFEVTNALARNNVGSTEIDIEEDEATGDLILTTIPEPVFPWIPSLGVQWKF